MISTGEFIAQISKKLKIAFFTDTYLPNIDGVVISILNTKKQLEKLGHEVIIFASGDREAKKKNKDKNVFYYPSIPFAPYPQYKIAIFTHGARGLLQKKRVDIIHSHGMGPMGMVAIYCSKMLGKPVVGTLHTNIQDATHYIASFKTAQEFLKQFIWKYLNVYYNQCDKTIVPCEEIARLCRENGIKNVVVSPMGIDIKKFKPKGARKKGERINILYLGRIVKEKNLEVVIKSSLVVAEKIKNVHFTIVGGGPAENYYKDMVKKEGVNHLFTFEGPVKPEETIKYYHNADVFVFPSIFETQGLSGLEAMSCGLPVAGANYLAIPDFVKNSYNGYLFDPFDSDDCAQSTVKTIEERKRLRKGAIATARKYSVDKCTNTLLDIYYDVINKSNIKKKRGITEKISVARKKIISVLRKVYVKRIQFIRNIKLMTSKIKTKNS